MIKEEIIAGLKSAIERGYSLEQAKQSFINAGYNPREVEEASSFVSSGILTNYPQFQPPQQPQPQIQPSQQQIQPIRQIQPQQIKPPITQLQPAQIQPQQSKARILVIILIILVLILILGLVTSLFFKDEIINFINSLFQ